MTEADVCGRHQLIKIRDAVDTHSRCGDRRLVKNPREAERGHAHTTLCGNLVEARQNVSAVSSGLICRATEPDVCRVGRLERAVPAQVAVRQDEVGHE